MSTRTTRPCWRKPMALLSGAFLAGAVWVGGAGLALGADPPTGEVIYAVRTSDATTLAVRPDGTGLTDTGCNGDRTHSGAPRRVLRLEPTGETFPTVSGTGWWNVLVTRLVARSDTCGDPVVLWEPGSGYAFDGAAWSIDGRRVALSGRHYDELGQIVEQGFWVGEVGGACGLPLCDVRLAVALPMIVSAVRPDGLVSYAGLGGQPRWSPDDRRLVYSRAIDPLVAGPIYGIYVADVGRPGEAGSGERRVVVSGVPASQFGATFSPAEGTDQIAFWVTTSPKGTVRNDIFVVSSAGGVARQVTTTRATSALQIMHPAWSPDGQWIAFDGFTSSVNGAALFKIRADGSGKAQMVASAKNANLYAPNWRR